MKPVGLQKKGDAQFNKAKDQITTSLFKWSKDYTSGASHFQQAYKCYKQAQCYPKAIDTLKQLILCNQKMTDMWACARNYESLIELYMVLADTPPQVLKETAINAFIHFRMAESLDKGLTVVVGVAKHFLQKGLTSDGLQLLQDAYKTGIEEKSYKKQEIFNQIVTLFLESNMIVEAERMYREEIALRKGEDCMQLGLIAVVLVVMQHEAGRANAMMYDLANEIPSFLESDECEVAEALIKAYKGGDSEGYKKITTKAAITCIFPLIIIRKLREVKVGEESNIKNLLY